MASRNDHEMHQVVGAINGDFYGSGGIPSGAQVLDGILLKRPYTTRSVFGSTSQKQPFIEVVSFAGQIGAGDGSTLQIDGVNETRDTDKLVLYNKYFGPTTQTNYWGAEITAQYLTGQLTVNDTVTVLALAKDSVQTSGHGNNAISSDGMVISGHGTARDFLNEHVFVGDTLFAGSIGRTDFPGGSMAQLLSSVKEKLFTLPGETKAYPGHGPATTIAREIAHNPFF